MRAIHTVASLRAEHGGPSRSVTALATALVDAGVDAQIVTTRSEHEGPPILPAAAVPVTFVPRPRRDERMLLPGSPFARELRAALGEGRGDVLLHDHGLWLPSNHAAARAARRGGVPRVASVRGMLSAWALAQGGGKKRLAWVLYQRRDLASAALLHVTSEVEAEEVRKAGIRTPSAVIPNGVHLPPEVEYQPVDTRQALFLARLHPGKGLNELIRAWPAVPAGWNLVVAGPDDGGHRAELEGLARELGIATSIRFVGEVGDEEKWALYRQADLFVLPSHSENFGIVVAEALAAGVPVITTHGTPWRELETEGCGWWVPVGEAPLRAALSEATALDAGRLAAMGARGRALVERRYGWGRVAEQMREAYAWVLGDGPRPAFVEG